jgi:hypothetical protein
MSTTTQLKPRPTRTRKKKVTEQSYPSKVTITKEEPITLTKVKSHLPDIQLIDKDALWEDFRNRVKINNYELKEVMKDLKSVVEFTKKTYGRLSK